MTLPDLSERVRDVLAWVEEQRGYCRPPHLADAPSEVVDALRGPCAAYGDVVYGLVAGKLRDALDETPVCQHDGNWDQEESGAFRCEDCDELVGSAESDDQQAACDFCGQTEGHSKRCSVTKFGVNPKPPYTDAPPREERP